MDVPVQINSILNSIARLDLEDQSLIAEILNKRIVEARRNQIAERAKEAEENYRLGKVQSGSIEDLMMLLSDD